VALQKPTRIPYSYLLKYQEDKYQEGIQSLAKEETPRKEKHTKTNS